MQTSLSSANRAGIALINKADKTTAITAQSILVDHLSCSDAPIVGLY